MTTSVAIALAITIVVALQQCMQAAQTPVIKLRSSQRCPALTVDDSKPKPKPMSKPTPKPKTEPWPEPKPKPNPEP